MKILIVEDEIRTAQSLARVILTVRPQAEIVASLQSVHAAVRFFRESPAPALAFMDIQLADGLCFDIFREVTVPCPVIFCTAYDEFAIEGFKANGIAYILKPFDEVKVDAALEKWQQLKAFLHVPDIPPPTRQSFLVTVGARQVVIPVDDIACFFIRFETPVLVRFGGQQYAMGQSLDAIAAQLPPSQFYRVTRQCLVNFKAVQSVEHLFGRKLQVHLQPPPPENIVINKNNTRAFLDWLEQR